MVWAVADRFPLPLFLSVVVVTMTWAFCLMTSAGVRMAQETSSARAEAEAWMIGWGRRNGRSLLLLLAVAMGERPDLMAS